MSFEDLKTEKEGEMEIKEPQIEELENDLNALQESADKVDPEKLRGAKGKRTAGKAATLALAFVSLFAAGTQKAEARGWRNAGNQSVNIFNQMANMGMQREQMRQQERMQQAQMGAQERQQAINDDMQLRQMESQAQMQERQLRNQEEMNRRNMEAQEKQAGFQREMQMNQMRMQFCTQLLNNPELAKTKNQKILDAIGQCTTMLFGGQGEGEQGGSPEQPTPDQPGRPDRPPGR
jgi:hypothetical protein